MRTQPATGDTMFVILYDVGDGENESREEGYYAYFSSIEKAVQAFEDCWGDRPDVNFVGIAQMVAYPKIEEAKVEQITDKDGLPCTRVTPPWMTETCEGCNDKTYRLSTRSDGVRDVERCDTCSEHMTDREALILSGQEGLNWMNGHD